MTDKKVDNNINEQAALDLHKIMLEAMRSRESEILHFIEFLLPAIVGFFTIDWLRGVISTDAFKILLPAVSAVTILIFFSVAGMP